jgi:hypothetical protein
MYWKKLNAFELYKKIIKALNKIAQNSFNPKNREEISLKCHFTQI